jgi:hypothetical protein
LYAPFPSRKGGFFEAGVAMAMASTGLSDVVKVASESTQ